MADSGLSYDQGPPFGAPLRLFLTAPLFPLLAACLGLVMPDWQTTRWTGVSLAMTHLITLGYLGMVMLGALLQMLPVVLGSPVPAARLVGWCGWLGLGLGAPGLALGFLLGEPLWLVAGTLLLALGLVPFSIAIAVSLIKTRAPRVAWPIRLATLALLITLALGSVLAGALSGLWPVQALADLTALHAAWGLLGWVLILVIGVAYQVVPMLQITPDYPAWVTRWLTWLMLAGLLLYSAPSSTDWLPNNDLPGALPLCASCVVFAVVTLRLQARRRRRIADVSLDFWRLGMVSLILAALLFAVLHGLPAAWMAAAEISLGILFLLGFAASVVQGMLYKIVPFLAWFHLKTQTGARLGAIPNMKQMLPEPLVRQHFRLHLAMLILLLAAPILPAPLGQVSASAGLLLLAGGAMRLELNLRHAKTLFLRHGGRLGQAAENK
jgi:hypothetical protein